MKKFSLILVVLITLCPTLFSQGTPLASFTLSPISAYSLPKSLAISSAPIQAFSMTDSAWHILRITRQKDDIQPMVFSYARLTNQLISYQPVQAVMNNMPSGLTYHSAVYMYAQYYTIWQVYNTSVQTKDIYLLPLNKLLQPSGPFKLVRSIPMPADVPVSIDFTVSVTGEAVFMHVIPLPLSTPQAQYSSVELTPQFNYVKEVVYQLPPIHFRDSIKPYSFPYEFGFYYFEKTPVTKNMEEYRFFYVNMAAQTEEYIRAANPLPLQYPKVINREKDVLIADYTMGGREDTVDIRLVQSLKESMWLWNEKNIILPVDYRSYMTNHTGQREKDKKKMAPMHTDYFFQLEDGSLLLVGQQIPDKSKALDSTQKNKNKPIHLYGSILLTRLDSNGDLIWNKWIEHVSVKDNDLHTGYTCWTSEGNLYITHYEHKKNAQPDSGFVFVPLAENDSEELILVGTRIGVDGTLHQTTLFDNQKHKWALQLPQVIQAEHSAWVTMFYTTKKHEEGGYIISGK